MGNHIVMIGVESSVHEEMDRLEEQFSRLSGVHRRMIMLAAEALDFAQWHEVAAKPAAMPAMPEAGKAGELEAGLMAGSEDDGGPA